jgi:hypothetical protein
MKYLAMSTKSSDSWLVFSSGGRVVVQTALKATVEIKPLIPPYFSSVAKFFFSWAIAYFLARGKV